MKKFYVYEHWRLDRDECFYVGKGNGRRAYVMKKRNKHHSAIQAKVSREGFAIDVRIVACGLTEDEAFNLEIERISFWRDNGIDLANILTGGQGFCGGRHSKEFKQKISDIHTGRIVSDETRKRLSEAGKNNAEIHRNVWLNRKHNDSTKQKLSEVLKGKPKSDDHKAKVSAGLKAYFDRKKLELSEDKS